MQAAGINDMPDEIISVIVEFALPEATAAICAVSKRLTGLVLGCQVSYKQLSDPLRGIYWQFFRLTRLKLNPSDDITRLSECVGLKSLSLCMHPRIPSVSNLTNLRRLKLDRVDNCMELCTLPNLTKLHIRQCGSLNAAHLTNITTLYHIGIGISDDDLGTMTQLRKLYVHASYFPQSISQLTGLNNLVAQRVPGVPMPNLTSLSVLTSENFRADCFTALKDLVLGTEYSINPSIWTEVPKLKSVANLRVKHRMDDPPHFASFEVYETWSPCGDNTADYNMTDYVRSRPGSLSQTDVP